MAIQFLQDIDVSGEVQGTSLDINGNADISGTLAVGGNTTVAKTSDTLIESKATTAGAYFRANSAANNYFGFELYHDTTNAKWFLGNYVDHASLSSGDFAIVSGAKSNGDVRFKIDSSGNTTFAADITCGDDLFMPSGGVINFNSGDVTMTHSSNQLEVNGGNFVVQDNIECNDLDIGGTATGDGSGLTDLDGSQITTGTIASARLDADTAHLTTTQTFSGSKTFSAAVTISNATASSSKTTGALKVSGGVGVSGALNAGGDVVAYASSDKRYKDNLQPITDPIDKVKSLTGYTFTWNDKHEQFNGNNDIGVVAQEVEKILPEIVDTRDNGYKAVKYEKMVALLIEAVKDQQEQIDELKEKLNGNS